MEKMKGEIEAKVRGNGPRFDSGGIVDTDYWSTVLDQLIVHLAKMELSEIHSKMLVRQLEKLERHLARPQKSLVIARECGSDFLSRVFFHVGASASFAGGGDRDIELGSVQKPTDVGL